jgi:glucose-1-phosphate cytidylyltransferase
MTQVVILCGGLGTRLREETEFRPKPMVDVGGRPILWHIMKTYAHYGFNEFSLCLGYRGNIIKEYFLNYAAMNNDFTINLGRHDQIEYHGDHEEQDFKVTLVDTGLPTMTGGRIKKIKKYITSDTFMVTYGDGLADVNVSKLLKYHQEHGQIGTVTSVRPSSRFGVIDINDQNQVFQFREKPMTRDWISAGYFVFQKEFFNYLPDDDTCIMERGPMENLAKDKQLLAYQHEGFFFAMDTYREYEILNKMWSTQDAPWKVWS